MVSGLYKSNRTTEIKKEVEETGAECTQCKAGFVSNERLAKHVTLVHPKSRSVNNETGKN